MEKQVVPQDIQDEAKLYAESQAHNKSDERVYRAFIQMVSNYYIAGAIAERAKDVWTDSDLLEAWLAYGNYASVPNSPDFEQWLTKYKNKK